ncbi:hypothetical protein LWE61_10600 [Sphingobium sufflavum]|uniref:hypothetical protein n=1 Tax=Sphingobium sufflavum TaxID=1129547 RepID=UPI001F3CD0CB|nr:hypothetical protein [Sphingobium sufflavum]MCE7797007.1 hypothetical protein [Sphingobium sufflavum]
MKSMQMAVSLAPKYLSQSILPWTFDFSNAHFGLVNIDLGITPKPEVEQEVLDKVGSYGRQIGWLSEIVEILLARADRTTFSPQELRAIRIFEGRQAEIAGIKERHDPSGSAPETAGDPARLDPPDTTG